jgi:hypothetical protein
MAALLQDDPRLSEFRNQTAAFDRLDFSFLYGGGRVEVDLKEKIRRTSSGLAALWPEVPAHDLFVLDETVYRRIIWQGGGGYLLIHDRPGERWLTFGPWELTLGPRVRYRRWGDRYGAFPKGKVLLDLRTASHTSADFSLDDLLNCVDSSRARLNQVEAVQIFGQLLPEVGSPPSTSHE